MSLFNKMLRKQKKTVNRAGGEAFVQSPKWQLASLLLTNFVQDQYYRSANQSMQELVDLLAQVEPEFAAKAAIYARTRFGMRSVTHVLAAELAAHASGQSWAKSFYEKVIFRPDDMLEILAYFLAKGGKTVPNAMKKGFAQAFDKFDGYQLAKYRGEGKAVKLIDVVNLVHPVPTQRNAKALQQLVEGTLRSTETWESKLTQAGQTSKTETEKAEKKAEAWRELLEAGKLGYFALLRNLRNIAEQAPDLLDKALEMLIKEQLITHPRNLVMPFRYLTAYKQFEQLNTPESRKICVALSKALDISCRNVPQLTNTLVVVDNSGSMQSPAAGSQQVQCSELGAIFGMILAKRSNADLMEFGDTARYIRYRLDTPVLEFGRNFARLNKVGHGTNFQAIFEKAGRKYDRIVIFSDMQSWVGYYNPANAFAAYRQRTGADPYVYSFDLRGYGPLQFPENNVFQLAGFSEKVFDLMGMLETDREALIREIEQVEL